MAPLEKGEKPPKGKGSVEVTHLMTLQEAFAQSLAFRAKGGVALFSPHQPRM